MSHELNLRTHARADIEEARDRYALVGHGESFLDELDACDAFAILGCLRLDPSTYCGDISSPCGSGSVAMNNSL